LHHTTLLGKKLLIYYIWIAINIIWGQLPQWAKTENTCRSAGRAVRFHKFPSDQNPSFGRVMHNLDGTGSNFRQSRPCPPKNSSTFQRRGQNEENGNFVYGHWRSRQWRVYLPFGLTIKMQGQGAKPRSNSEPWGPEFKIRFFPFEKSWNQPSILRPKDECHKTRRSLRSGIADDKAYCQTQGGPQKSIRLQMRTQ
jgi:hypothetical protein